MSMDLDSVFDHTPALLFIADGRGTLLRQSKAMADRFGALQGEASLAALVGPEGHASVEVLLAELAAGKESVTSILHVRQGDGTTTKARCTARRAPDASVHGQLELVDDTPEALTNRIEHELLRAILTTLDIVLWAIDSSGKFVFHDGKALATAGLRPGQFLGMNIFELYPPEMLSTIKQTFDGNPSKTSSEVHGVHWQTWNIPIKNPRGEIDHVAGLSLDVSDAVRTKLELERRLNTIQEQQRAIHELSAPVINVWDNVLTVPLIGSLDNRRANELIERLLAAASRSGTNYVILDLTGVDALDTLIAGHILRLLQSLHLLGVEGLVTGISPQVAQTMVGLGIELEQIRTFRSLREGLRHCMKQMYTVPTPSTH